MCVCVCVQCVCVCVCVCEGYVQKLTQTDCVSIGRVCVRDMYRD